MSHELRHAQVYGNFRPPRIPNPRKKERARDKRPGMSPEHLALIRQLPCCVTGLSLPVIDPHHLKSAGERGAGLKATDRWCVPLCRQKHDEVERIGSRREVAWFHAHGIDPLALAAALWSATGNLDRMRKIVMTHLENREAIKQ